MNLKRLSETYLGSPSYSSEDDFTDRDFLVSELQGLLSALGRYADTMGDLSQDLQSETARVEKFLGKSF